MNVLSTFFYLFESDTRALEEGTRRSDRAAQELGRTLDATDRRASMLGSSLLEMVRGLGKTLAAGLSAGALMVMIRNTSNAVGQVDDLARALGVSAGELDAWDSAAAAAGGAVGGLSGSLRAFNERVHDLTRTQSPELLAMFGRLGLSLDEVKAKASDPLALLAEMADGMAELSGAEGAALGQKLGLDPGTIALLRQGRIGLDEVLARQRELGYITDEQIEKNRKYQAAQERIARVWADLRRQLTFAVLPALERLSKFFEDGARLAREHSDTVAWGLGVIATAAALHFAPAMLRAATASGALWATLGRFAVVAAVLGAVALVAEDLYQFMRGNDSVTGELAKKWPLLGDAIRAVGDHMAWMIALTGGIAEAVVALFTGGPQAAIDSFRETVRRIGADMEAQYPALAGIGDVLSFAVEAAMTPFRVLVAVVEGSTAAIAALIHEGPSAALRELGQWVRSLADRFPEMGRAADGAVALMRRGVQGLLDVWRRVVDMIGKAVQLIPGAGLIRGAVRALAGGAAPAGLETGQLRLAEVASAPVGNVSSAAIVAGARTSNRTTSVQVDRVEVNTQATDAEGIASGIGSALERELVSASDSFDDGVAA